MKKECEIVKDLLFCYNDGIASNSSKELVESHIKDCETCRLALEEMQKDKNQQDNKEEIDYLKKINKKMKRKTAITVICAIILIIFVVVNVYILFTYYNEGHYIRILLNDEISYEQLENISHILEEKCGKDKVSYSSREDELNNVKELFKDKSNLLDTYQNANPFKAVFTVKTKEKNKEEILQILERLEGIDHITTDNIDNPYLWFIARILKNR